MIDVLLFVLSVSAVSAECLLIHAQVGGAIQVWNTLAELNDICLDMEKRCPKDIGDMKRNVRSARQRCGAWWNLRW